jgi:hypothetical protein
MEYLQLQTDFVGYPLIVFYFVAIIGCILVLWQPLWAFLFTVFCLSGKHFHAAVLTRTALTGEYLNLNDLLLWIAILAVISKIVRTDKIIILPKILIAIIAILSIGAIQAVVKYGPEAFVLRSIWSVAIFPIMFLVGTNMVRSASHARLFYWALFLGSVMAAIQHILFLGFATAAGIFEGHLLRIISYVTSAGLYLLIISLFFKIEEKSKWVLLVYYLGLILMAISAVMNQTRQLYFVSILTFGVITFLLRKNVSIKKTILKLGIVVVSVIVITNLAFDKLSLSEIVGERIDTIIEKEAREETSLTRLISMQTEINLWLDSTIIFGTGVAYPPEYTEPYRAGERDAVFQTGALDHVAFTSYLAHYGLIGFLLYLIFLPLLTIKAAMENLDEKNIGYGRMLVLLAITVALMDILNPLGSMLQTAPTSHIAALIYGALWGFHYGKTKTDNVTLVSLNKEVKTV